MTDQLETLAEPVDPAIAAAANVEPPELPVEPVGDPPPPVPPRTQMVPLEVVTGLRAKNRELESAAAQARREAQEARELADRLSARAVDPNAPPGTVQPPRPASIVAPPSNDADVDRRAAELLFIRDAHNVSEAGFKTYGQTWNESIKALDAYGINSPDFVSSVMEVDRSRTHEIMHQIAQDGEKAIALAAMSPARRIAEITRISIAMAANTASSTATPPAGTVPPKTPVAAPVAPARTVSRAPAPPPPIDPGVSRTVDWRSDPNISDADWSKQWNENAAKRAKQR